MTAAASAHSDLSPSGLYAMDFEGSNASSPLSDVADGDAHDDEVEHMQVDGRGHVGDKFSLGGDPSLDANDGSDFDSALSDAASDVNSDANATDAETERLFNTPQNHRLRDVVVDRFNNDRVFERTPSQPSKYLVPEKFSCQNASVFDDDDSLASNRAERALSLSRPATTNDLVVHEDTRQEALKRKRKRSPAIDQSELNRSPRKRVGSSDLAQTAADKHTSDFDEDDAMSANPQSGHHSTGEDEISSPSNREKTADAPERPMRSTNSVTCSLKQHSLSVRDAVAEADSDTRENQADDATDEDVENQEEDPNGDAKEEMDPAAKNIEEMEKKHAAFKDWTHIEEMFSVFRERLYKDRLQQLEEEEQSLMADEPTHPEYLSMKKCIEDRLKRRLREIDTEYELRIQAHEQRAVAQRAQIWSQFFQAVREKREHALEGLNQQWYEVQSARRSAHSLPDYGLLFPKEHTQRLRNAIAYNTEVSTLASLAKYEGFPAGPDLRGASSSEVEADLNAIEHVRRARHQHGPHHSRDDYHATTFSRLGPAGEQFIKDTPWANPKHSAHKPFQQAPNQTGVAARRAAQAVSLPPAGDVRAALEGQSTAHKSPALSSRISESPEMARNKPNQAANHSMRRVNSIPPLPRGSKAAVA